jgi:signal transduction histidine kinase
MKRRASPQPWTLRRRIGQSFLALGAVLAILVGAVSIATVEFVLAGNRVVYRWQPAVTTTQRLLTDLLDQETGLRGYALSKDPTFLRPYRQASITEGTDRRRLTSLLGSDRTLQRKLTDLRRAVAAWRTDIATPAITAIRTGDTNGDALVQSRLAKQRFDEIRTQSARLAALVQKRSSDARDTRKRYGVLFVVAITLTAAMLAMIGIAIWRGLHRWVLTPVDRLGRQTRQVSSGDTYRQIVPAGPVEFVGLGRDVEAMRLQIAGQLARAEEIQEQLRQRGEELARSNDDLQQFAYVASHDLSEPLRKVANFCQLLERQYSDQLDDRARQYIDFAVDGAKRMQALISDLLALSRVGRTTDEFTAVPLDVAVDEAVGNLAFRIEEAGGTVERSGALPTVQGDRSLLVSLFENLIGNAVKYRREGVAPVVRISAEQDADAGHWTFTVCDNGIGIDPQYAERIFAVFQRLHLRDSYGGTGIGLALCRRIVEFHGGRIWLEHVESGEGAVFMFTLPEGAVLAESRD